MQSQVQTLIDGLLSADAGERSSAAKTFGELQKQKWCAVGMCLAEMRPSNASAKRLVSHLLREHLGCAAAAAYADADKAWRDRLHEQIRHYPLAAAKLLRLDIDVFDDQSLLSDWLALVAGVDPTTPGALTQSLADLLRTVASFFKLGSLPIQLHDGNRLLTLIVASAMSLLSSNSDDELLPLFARALSAMLPFIDQNMAVPKECQVVMLCIVKLCGARSCAVRVHGLKALTKVAEHYYEVLRPHMHAVFPALSAVMQAAANERDQLAALRFWDSVAAAEQELESCPIIQQASGHLLRLLFPLVAWHAADDDGSTVSVGERNQRVEAADLIGQIVAATPAALDGVLAYVAGALGPDQDWKQRGACCDIVAALVNHGGMTTQRDALLALLPQLLALAGDDRVFYVQEAATTALSNCCAWLGSLPVGQGRMLVDFLLSALQASPPPRSELVAPLCWGVVRACESLGERDAVDPKAEQLLGAHYERIVEIGMVLLHGVPSARSVITEMLAATIALLPEHKQPLITRLYGYFAAAVHSIASTAAAAHTPDTLWPLAPALVIIDALCRKQDAPFDAAAVVPLAMAAVTLCRSPPITGNAQLAAIVEDCIPDALLIIAAVLSKQQPVGAELFAAVAQLCLSFVAADAPLLWSSPLPHLHSALILLSDLCLSAPGGDQSDAKQEISRAVAALIGSKDVERSLKPLAVSLLGDLMMNWSSPDAVAALPGVARTLIHGFEAAITLWKHRHVDDAERQWASMLTRSLAETVSALVLSHKVVPAILRPFQTLVNVCLKEVEPFVDEDAVDSQLVDVLLLAFCDVYEAYAKQEMEAPIQNVAVDQKHIGEAVKQRLKSAGIRIGKATTPKPELEGEDSEVHDE